jgi:hypothetical protein
MRRALVNPRAIDGGKIESDSAKACVNLANDFALCVHDDQIRLT